MISISNLLASVVPGGPLIQMVLGVARSRVAQVGLFGLACAYGGYQFASSHEESNQLRAEIAAQTERADDLRGKLASASEIATSSAARERAAAQQAEELQGRIAEYETELAHRHSPGCNLTGADVDRLRRLAPRKAGR